MQDNTLLAEAASVPAVPSSPKVFVDTVLGFIVGVFLGGALAILLERFDRRLREAREIEESYGLPVLGLVPRGVTIEGMRDNAVLSVEPFRMLRAHLRYFNVDRTLKVLLVTSAKPAEGKSTIASNLAATAAGMGTSTLLIEADLRKPALSQRLALAPSIGLSGVLVSVGTELEAIQEIAVAGTVNAHGGRMLSVLSAGVVPPNPTELLESQAMERLLEWARENYELVIVDTAPLSVVADTIPLVKAVDGVIIVSRLGFSTRDSAEHLRGRLESLGTPTLGVVINDARRRESSSYGYAYGYYGDKQSMDPVAGGDGPATETPEQASTEAPEDADAVVSGATATQFSAAGGTSNDRGNGVTSTEPTAFGSLGTNRPQ
jgi:receptor protein-tyrosine kinase